jgi:RNase P subunit RPR2
MPLSIKAVAAHAGVSVGTVSKVLNNPETVRERTRDRVNAAIKELGYVRNESARQLRAGRSRTIGLVVLDVANPFFTDLARGVENEASRAGLAVILCNSDDKEHKERRYLDSLEEHRVSGVLITPVGEVEALLTRLRRGVCRWCWSTAGPPPTVSVRWRSTTCSAVTVRCRTCWPTGMSESRTSRGRPPSGRSPTGSKARPRRCAARTARPAISQ